MKSTPSKKDIFPTEFILKLFRDFPLDDYQRRCAFLDEFFEQNKETEDINALQREIINWKGLVYFEAQKFSEAAEYYKKALRLTHVNSFSYSVTITSLIRCLINLERYKEAKQFVLLAFQELKEFNSPIDDLNLLEQYCKIAKELNEELPEFFIPLLINVRLEFDNSKKEFASLFDEILYFTALEKATGKAFGTLELQLALDKEKKDSRILEQKFREFLESCQIPQYREMAITRINYLEKINCASV